MVLSWWSGAQDRTHIFHLNMNSWPKFITQHQIYSTKITLVAPISVWAVHQNVSCNTNPKHFTEKCMNIYFKIPYTKPEPYLKAKQPTFGPRSTGWEMLFYKTDRGRRAAPLVGGWTAPPHLVEPVRSQGGRVNQFGANTRSQVPPPSTPHFLRPSTLPWGLLAVSLSWSSSRHTKAWTKHPFQQEAKSSSQENPFSFLLWVIGWFILQGLGLGLGPRGTMKERDGRPRSSSSGTRRDLRVPPSVPRWSPFHQHTCANTTCKTSQPPVGDEKQPQSVSEWTAAVPERLVPPGPPPEKTTAVIAAPIWESWLFVFLFFLQIHLCIWWFNI